MSEAETRTLASYKILQVIPAQPDCRAIDEASKQYTIVAWALCDETPRSSTGEQLARSCSTVHGLVVFEGGLCMAPDLPGFRGYLGPGQQPGDVPGAPKRELPEVKSTVRAK